MTLAYQMAEHKRKSQAINDFVIEATYLKDLAAQVLYAQGPSLNTQAFQEACQILRDLCQTLQASVARLEGFVPLSSLSHQDETQNIATEASLGNPRLDDPSLKGSCIKDPSLQDTSSEEPSFPLLTPPFA